MKQLRFAEIDSPRAWITVITAFMSCFTLFGVAYSFGAFFRPMGMEFGARRMPTAAVFSITAGIYNALGAPAGHLSDRYGPRPAFRHKRAGRIEERDGKLYATQSTETEQRAAV